MTEIHTRKEEIESEAHTHSERDRQSREKKGLEREGRSKVIKLTTQRRETTLRFLPGRERLKMHERVRRERESEERERERREREGKDRE